MNNPKTLLELRVKIGSVAHVQEAVRGMLIDEVMADIAALSTASGKPILVQVYDIGLEPLETVRYWAGEFAKDPQAMAGGKIVQLLNEYAQLREIIAAAPAGLVSVGHTRAAEMLRESAAELLQGHTVNGAGDWTGEPEAKAAYDEHLQVANALTAAVAPLNRASSNALSTFSMSWKLNGDWMTCTACKRNLIASRDGELLVHAAGCKQADHQHPWRTLRSLLSPYAPIGDLAKQQQESGK